MAAVPDFLRGEIAVISDKVGAVGAHIALRFRRWREDRQTWAALRQLDDRQLKEFGIYSRPPELIKRKFP